MRGLFTKIFLGFWIAQSLTFFISTMLILRHRFLRPSESDGSSGRNPSQRGRCRRECIRDRWLFGIATVCRIASPNDLSGRQRQPIFFAEQALSRLLQAELTASQTRARGASKTGWRRISVEHGDPICERPPIPFPPEPPSHRQHLWAARSSVISRFLNFPVAIVVFGLTTFVLVLSAGPAHRQASRRRRSLANGELATRVAEPDGEERLFGGDEIQGLVHDFNYMAERLERLVGRTEDIAARRLPRIAIAAGSSERCPGIGAGRSACGHDGAFAAHRA